MNCVSMCPLVLFGVAVCLTSASSLSNTLHEKPSTESLDYVRQFCIMQKEMQFCDGFLCRVLFDSIDESSHPTGWAAVCICFEEFSYQCVQIVDMYTLVVLVTYMYMYAIKGGGNCFLSKPQINYNP